MISVEEALSSIVNAAEPMAADAVPLAYVAGQFQAEDFLAPHPHPFFDQSAMDGYALRHADLAAGTPLKVTGEIRAGDKPEPAVGAGEAVRIFTGAPVPAGADTVVMQEMTERNDDLVTITGEVQAGANVRKQGEQIAKGGVAIPAGAQLNAARVGLLATFGETEASCRRAPVIAILSTGSEFTTSASELGDGKIFESNGLMLRAALHQMGLESFLAQVEDDPDEILKRVEEASTMANVLLTTGGVSVGAYDYTRSSLEQCGFEVVFHKVNQKPGKPLLFAKKRPNRAAFGLPGNPRSALTSFYRYVYPYLRKLMGASELELPSLELPLVNSYRKKDGKTHFVTGQIEGGGVRILQGQNSHMLASFGAADLLVEIPAEAKEVAPGTKLRTWVLPR